MIPGASMPPRSTLSPTGQPESRAYGTPEPAPQGVQLLRGQPTQPAGTIALRLMNADPIWISGTEDVTVMLYHGDPQDLNADEVLAIAHQVSGTGAHHAAPGEIQTLQFQVTGGDLDVIMTAPAYPPAGDLPEYLQDIDEQEDLAGTPGATPHGLVATRTAAHIAQKVMLVPELLDGPLPPVMAQIVTGYLGAPIGGADETLPMTPLAAVEKMPLTATAWTGTRIYLPAADGAAAVQGIFLGHTGDNGSSLVLLEAPPPPEAGFDPADMHPHPNGVSVIYRHPMEIEFRRDPVQPPRQHLAGKPTLQALEAAVGHYVLLAPSADEVGLPVALLAVTPMEGEPGQRMVRLQVRSNFHPENDPLGAWEGAWYEGEVTSLRDAGAGQYEWAVHTDLNGDGMICAWVTLDPMETPPNTPYQAPHQAPHQGEAPATAPTDDKRMASGKPAGQPVGRLEAGDFSTMTAGTPLLLNGMAAQFTRVAASNEPAEAIWVTTDAGADGVALGSMYSEPVKGSDPPQTTHLVQYTQTLVRRAMPEEGTRE